MPNYIEESDFYCILFLFLKNDFMPAINAALDIRIKMLLVCHFLSFSSKIQ